MSIVWVTSFAKDMYEASGRPLLDSFSRHAPAGVMVAATEGLVPFEVEKGHQAVRAFARERDEAAGACFANGGGGDGEWALVEVKSEFDVVQPSQVEWFGLFAGGGGGPVSIVHVVGADG